MTNTAFKVKNRLQLKNTGGDTYYSLFQNAALSANRTYTFPNADATIASINNAQTFTGLQTFSNAISTTETTFTGGTAGNGKIWYSSGLQFGNNIGSATDAGAWTFPVKISVGNELTVLIGISNGSFDSDVTGWNALSWQSSGGHSGGYGQLTTGNPYSIACLTASFIVGKSYRVSGYIKRTGTNTTTDIQAGLLSSGGSSNVGLSPVYSISTPDDNWYPFNCEATATDVGNGIELYSAIGVGIDTLSVNQLNISEVFEVGSSSYGTLAAFRSFPDDGINPYFTIDTSNDGVTLAVNGSSYKSLIFSTSGVESGRVSPAGVWTFPVKVVVGFAPGISNTFEVGSVSYGTLAAFRSIPSDGINPSFTITTSTDGVTLGVDGSAYKSLIFSTSAVEAGRVSPAGAWSFGSSTATQHSFTGPTTTLKLTPNSGTVAGLSLNDYGVIEAGSGLAARFKVTDSTRTPTYGKCGSLGEWTFGPATGTDTVVHTLNAYTSAYPLILNNRLGGPYIAFQQDGAQKGAIGISAVSSGYVFENAAGTDTWLSSSNTGAWQLGASTGTDEVTHILYGYDTTAAGAAIGLGALAVYNRSTTAEATALNVVKGATATDSSNRLVTFLTSAGAAGQGQINGNGASACAFGSFSDRRLKENIVELPSQLDNICNLVPVEFDYRDGSGHQIGFIAQDIEVVYPDAVNITGETSKMKTVTGWGKTEARLVKAIQEQQSIIESLLERIEALEA